MLHQLEFPVVNPEFVLELLAQIQLLCMCVFFLISTLKHSRKPVKKKKKRSK